MGRVFLRCCVCCIRTASAHGRLARRHLSNDHETDTGERGCTGQAGQAGPRSPARRLSNPRQRLATEYSTVPCGNGEIQFRSGPEAGTRNTFTNRIATPAGSHNGYSVILIDNLFTIFGDPDKEPGGRALARLQALRTLRSIPSGEKIAIYAVGRKLEVICEFTSDRDLLERQLTAWTPSVDAPATSGEVLVIAIQWPSPGLRASQSLAAAQEAARLDALQRAARE